MRPGSFLLAPLLLLPSAALGAAPAGDNSGEIAVQERVPLAVVLINPRPDIAKTHGSEIILSLTELLKPPRTNLALNDASEQVRLAGCKSNLLSCAVRAVRSDYNREALVLGNGEVPPYVEHLRQLKDRKITYPRFVLLFSNLSQEGKADRLTALLIDTDEALATYHDADRSRQGWEGDVEANVNEYAVKARPKTAQISNAEETSAYLDKLINTDCRKALEEAGNWDPYGEIDLRAEAGGVGIQLDGATIGTTRPGSTRIRFVTPGKRQVELRSPEFKPYTTVVDVTRGGVATVSVGLSREAGGVAGTLRTSVFWTGLGIAAVGAGITTYAIASGNDKIVWCFYKDMGTGAPASCGSGKEWRAFGSGDNSATSNPNPGSVPIAPLGYSLVGLGGVWALGAALFSESDELPWKEVVAGLVIGGASMGVSVALGGSTAFKKM